MSLKVAYKKNPDSRDGFYYAAYLPVSIALPEKNSPRTKRFEALIDSGASYCMFNAAIGKAIGLEIEKGELVKSFGISGPANSYLHNIHLHAPGGIIETIGCFSDELPVLGLLGMRGFFDHFNVLFDSTALECEITRLFQA